jgi:outer membrane lipoprotein-sorting protein
MAKNDLNEILNGLGGQDPPDDVRQMADDLAGRFRRSLAQTQQHKHSIWRELIMRNRIAQLAAAAAIITAVSIVLYHLGVSPDGANVAWGDVSARVKNAPTVTYKARLTMNDPQGRQVVDESDVYVDQEQRCRIDSRVDGQPHTIKYLVPARKTFVMVQPELKKYMEGTLSDAEVAEMLEQQDPRRFCPQVLAGDYSKLGRSEIDGIEVEGIEAPLDNQTLRLWVDVKTNWPVRIEVDGKFGQHQSSHVVFDRFQWDAELDPALFEPNIPADYTPGSRR